MMAKIATGELEDDGGDERAVLNDRPSEFSRSFFIHHEILQRPGSRRLRRILQQTVTKKDRRRLHAPILLGSKFLPLGPSSILLNAAL
jgi:hypothetical protein